MSREVNFMLFKESMNFNQKQKYKQACKNDTRASLHRFFKDYLRNKNAIKFLEINKN